jgi:LacI family transcriptional regulator
MARHLWELGHRRYAVVRGPASHGAAARRVAGFIDELQKLGLEQPVIEADAGFSFEGGIAAGGEIVGSEFLDRNDRPTAIFAGNDDSAAGVMVACSQAGVRVPQDVSVCGFDDSWIARSVWPYLTTVYQPIEEMGRAATALLLRREEPESVLHQLDFHVVIRDSTAPPAA